MAEPTRYDFMDAIKYPDGQRNINAVGYMVGGVPFLNSGDAVSWLRDKFPEMTPQDHAIAYDPATAKQTAAAMLPELEHIRFIVRHLADENHAEIERLSKEQEQAPDNTVMDTVNKELRSMKIRERVGYGSALYEVLGRLSDRIMELWNLAHLKL